MRVGSVIVVLVALGAGAAGGWMMRGRAAERELRQVVLVDDVGQIGLAADALASLKANRAETVERLMFDRMRSAAHEAQEALAAGAHMPADLPTPNLVEGVRRAATLAAGGPDATLAATLAELRDAVAGAR